MSFKEFSKEFAAGCLGHFIIGVAAAILLGASAHYLGLSGWMMFLIIVVVVFSVSVLIPGPKRKKD